MTMRDNGELLLCSFLLTFAGAAFSAMECAQLPQNQKIVWPSEKRFALSLTFDDAAVSQPVIAVPLLDKYGVKATFYVHPAKIEKQLVAWKSAVSSGHEIGNHTLDHPCSGNFSWSRNNALEDYTLERMWKQIEQTNLRIHELLGVSVETFAYPCGETFVGRGVDTRSYVFLVAERFLAGRGFGFDKSANDAAFMDFAQITGISIDAKDFSELLPVLEKSRKDGLWLVLVGHDIGTSGDGTTRTSTLAKLMEFARDRNNGIWIAPVAVVAKYVRAQRHCND
jgi:peptidoglycan-N-acetylglucosamine deacetylase